MTWIVYLIVPRQELSACFIIEDSTGSKGTCGVSKRDGLHTFGLSVGVSLVAADFKLFIFKLLAIHQAGL